MADSLRLEALTLSGVRNLQPLTFEPGPRFNVVFGDNGAGKSNLLEAIAYLASLRSFRGAAKEDIIASGQETASMVAKVSAEPLSREYRIQMHRERPRSIVVDGKRPSSLGAYYTTLQLVLFHPADVELAIGGPTHRRAFLDRMLEQLDAGYARLLAEYDKALRSRNRLLKSERPDARSITAYDAMLASHGARVGAARARLVADLAPLAEAHFAEITDHGLPLSLSYAARHEPDAESLAKALRDSYAKDLARGFTGVGPHGDDLRIGVFESLAKHHASQGQHRAIVLALKVAELLVLGQRTGRVPILLLDDVSSELDRTRNRRLFGLLSRLGGQVFLTTTHREFILLDEARADFKVERGTIEQVA